MLSFIFSAQSLKASITFSNISAEFSIWGIFGVDRLENRVDFLVLLPLVERARRFKISGSSNPDLGMYMDWVR